MHILPVVGTKYHLYMFRVGEALIVAVAVRRSPGYQWVGLSLTVMVKKIQQLRLELKNSSTLLDMHYFSS